MPPEMGASANDPDHSSPSDQRGVERDCRHRSSSSVGDQSSSSRRGPHHGGGGKLNCSTSWAEKEEEEEHEYERKHRSRSSIGDDVRLTMELAAVRRRIGFWRHPIVTLRHFGKCLARWARSTARAVAAHPAFVLVAVPGVVAWLVLEAFPGPHTEVIVQAKHVIKFVVWWVGLGTVSSVGLGCGFQTGVLFLFPHIMKTCLAVEECNSLDFPSSGDMWFAAPENIFSCGPEGEADYLMGAGAGAEEALFEGGHGGQPSSVSFLGTFMKVYPACLLWGIGTAIGEIPPYALSRAAAEAGEEADADEELWDLEHRDPKVLGKFDVVTRLKMWMIALLKRKGFMGVFLLASVPNMAFDLCGMCCGHFMMPFSTFFTAVLLGKAGVKIILQTAFFTMAFHEHHLEAFIAIVRRWTPESLNLGGILHVALVQLKAQFHTLAGDGGGGSGSGSGSGSGGVPVIAGVIGVDGVEGAGGFVEAVLSRLKAGWTVLLVVIVLAFAGSCIEEIAKRSAAYEDKETVRLFREGNMLREREKHRFRDRPRGQSSASFFAGMQAVGSDEDDDDAEEEEDRD
ncbi:unnamed protein product [Pylaiella littoralis]